MALVKMLRNARGSQHGYDVDHFEKDEVREVTESLAKSFVENGDAELVDAPQPTEDGVVYAKAKKGAPKDKAKKGAPEDKSEEPPAEV